MAVRRPRPWNGEDVCRYVDCPGPIERMDPLHVAQARSRRDGSGARCLRTCRSPMVGRGGRCGVVRLRTGMRRLRALGLVTALALLGGCGGDHERDVLEDILSAGGISFCNGGCHDFDTTGATCTRNGVRHGGRDYYDCTVTYDGTEYVSHVCAALAPDTDHGYIARDDCRPRPQSE
jgi:hypothetical protein